MSDRKLYWTHRLGSSELRRAWWSELEGLGLFADVRATDASGRTDEQGTHFLIGRRTVALQQFDEARRLVPQLVSDGFMEFLMPQQRQEKNEDG